MRTATLALRFSFLAAILVGLPLLAAPKVLRVAKSVLDGNSETQQWCEATVTSSEGTTQLAKQTAAQNNPMPATTLDSPSAEVMPVESFRTLTLQNLDYRRAVEQLTQRGAIGCNVEPVHDVAMRPVSDPVHQMNTAATVPPAYRFRCLLRLPDSVYYRVYTAENRDPAAAARAVLAQLPEQGSVRVTSEHRSNRR